MEEAETRQTKSNSSDQSIIDSTTNENDINKNRSAWKLILGNFLVISR